MWMLGGAFAGYAGTSLAALQPTMQVEASLLLQEDITSFFLLEGDSSRVQLE